MEIRIGRAWEADREELLAELREFARLLKRAPFRNSRGLRGVSAFALYWFLRRVQPTIVFEVGVWKGFSTWLIEQAVPEAEVHCFDPMFFLRRFLNPLLIGRTYRSKRAHYSTQDFSCAPVETMIAGHARPLVFFDDHQNKLPRLMQCRGFGIRDLIFDDNMPDAGTHRTLEDERRDGNPALEREIERYEVFPALWPVDFRYGSLHIREEGLGFPVEKELRRVYDERQWHSSVTYVRLK